MRLPAALSPLRHRAFALVWFGAFVSNIGTWMEAVAVGILVTRTTGQNAWPAVVAAAAFLPGALLGPIGGAFADRYARKRVLLAGTAAQTGLAGLLAAVAAGGRPSPAVVAVIVFASGCAGALSFPSFQSLLPELVPADDLVGAVGLSSAQWNLGRVIGPVLAAVVIGHDRYALAFTCNTLSFFAVIVAVVALRLPGPRGRRAPIFRSIAEGFRYASRDEGIRSIVTLMAVNSLLAAPFIALVAPMALNVLHAGNAGTSALVTAQGLGAVTMAVALGPLVKRHGSRRVLVAVLWALPVALVLYASAPSIALAVPALYAVGLLYLGALSSFTSSAQLRVPDEYRGRVMSVLNLVLGALYPVGSIAIGSLGDRIGLRWSVGGAAVLMLVVLGALRVLRPGLTGALEVAPAAVAEPVPVPSGG